VAVYEVDVAQTKDGHLVLLHDKTIDRTTTGSGNVDELTYDELKQFNLVDDYGNETTFKIPLFSDVLDWCVKQNVILTVDIKKTVSQKVVIDAIKTAKAEDHSIIITYDVEQAVSAYQLAPQLLLSVSATLGNLDKSAAAKGDELYRQWKEKGVDIIATDRPFEASKAIN